jgi:hypothetical protein
MIAAAGWISFKQFEKPDDIKAHRKRNSIYTQHSAGEFAKPYICASRQKTM